VLLWWELYAQEGQEEMAVKLRVLGMKHKATAST
jgi:hypothetical protein